MGAIVGGIVMWTSAMGAASAQPAVRLPTSAADWATFTTAQRQAALSYVTKEFEDARANGTLIIKSIDAAGALSVASTAGAFAPASITAGVDCGFNVSSFTEGTWTWGWANANTTAPVWEIDTGWWDTTDLFYRDNSLLQHFGQGFEGGSNSYVYASTTANFKWWFEQATYVVQSWGTAQTSYHSYVMHDRYCYLSYSP